MAKPERDVAAALSRLGCSVGPAQVAALAKMLTSEDSILMAIDGEISGFLGGNSHVVAILTCLGVFASDYKKGVHEGCKRLYWQDVANIRFGDFGFELFGYGNAGYVSAVFSEGCFDSARLQAFVQELQNRVVATKAPIRPTGPSSMGDALIAQLERLAKLRESGAVTQEEFDLAKRKLLQS